MTSPYDKLKAEAARNHASMSSKKLYSDAEKAAYWKAKYKNQGSNRNSDSYYRYQKFKTKQRQKTADAARKRGPGIISEGGKLVGGMIGSAIGTPLSTPIGSFLGGKIGHLIEQITGFGDYRIANNTVMTGGMTPPQVVNSMSKGGYIVRHREFLGNINASTAFTIQTYALNPGLSSSFPWLSQIAGAYEQYRWRGLLFEFKSMSSDAVLSSATSSALGTVSMATQYNSLDVPFGDLSSMLNYEFANSRKPSESFIHPVECKSSQTPVSILYTRIGQLPANSDQRLYDLGEFNIATSGMQAASGVAGQLWCTYEVEFFKCKFNPSDLTDHFIIPPANITNSTPFGSATQPYTQSTSGSTLRGGVNSNTYAFQPTIGTGQYLIVYQVTGASTVWTAPTITLTNCVALNIMKNNTVAASGYPTNGVNNSVCCVIQFIQITGPGASFTFSGQVLPTSPTSADLYVTQIARSLN